ncbi:hypothetical protein ACWTU6_21005 [Mesorhizobium sp. BHbsci]
MIASRLKLSRARGSGQEKIFGPVTALGKCDSGRWPWQEKPFADSSI